MLKSCQLRLNCYLLMNYIRIAPAIILFQYPCQLLYRGSYCTVTFNKLYDHYLMISDTLQAILLYVSFKTIEIQTDNIIN